MTPLQVQESTWAWEEDYPDYPDYPAYLSQPKDRRPPSIHSSPLAAWNLEAEEEALKEWTFEAEEDRLKNRPDNAFYRLLRKVTSDMRAKAQKEAEALGFPSWEAKERHDKEEGRKRLEEYVEEHGHLPQPPPVTEETRIAFERRQERQREAERELLEPRCNCMDHVAFWFCPQRLRGYKSQGHNPSNFHFLQSLHPTDLNVHIEEGDPSKRVSERWLEYIWAMPSPSRILHLPLWAKRDDVVQHMINREEVDEILYYGDPELQKKPPLPRSTVSSSVSSWPDSGVEANAEGLRVLECQGTPEGGAAGLNLKQSLPKDTTDVDETLASSQAEINTELSGTGSHSAGGPPTRGRFKDASDLGVHETTRISQERSSKIKKRPGAKKEATRKAALSDKIQTHAQEVLNFLAGDSDACATSLSHH